MEQNKPTRNLHTYVGQLSYSNKDCVMCKHGYWIHNGKDHPFFGNNLEMLEWEYEKATR